MTTAEIIEVIKGLSVLELNELVKKNLVYLHQQGQLL